MAGETTPNCFGVFADMNGVDMRVGLITLETDYINSIRRNGSSLYECPGGNNWLCEEG